MGQNTTGKPNTNDYSLGRGILYFSPLDSNGKPGAWRDLGNAPEFTVTLESEELEHQSSRGGLKVTDKEVVISQSASCAFSLDELNHQNIAIFLSGDSVASITNGTVAGFSEYQMITAVELGRWYDIVNASGVRCYDLTSSAGLTVEKSGAPDVLLVEGTDYEVDLKMGRIFFLSTAVNVAAGNAVDVTLAADATAKSINEVRALTKTNVIGALKFIRANPANNDKLEEWEFHKISLKPEGDLAMIGDDWSKLGFTGTAEANSAYPNSPTLSVRDHADS